MKIILLIIIVIGLLWGYGFYKGYSDVENGSNLLTYKLVSSGMNPISRHGYKTFFINFTDYSEVYDSFDEKTSKSRFLTIRLP